MKPVFVPKTKLEKFGAKIYFLLVENFPQTFFVGGMVRDLLLHRKITDIDIATSATPDEVLELLMKSKVVYDDKGKNFGNVAAKRGNLSVEITTFRQDLNTAGRYPKVKFVNSAKKDSQRRDFTINSLYLSIKNNKVLDFYQGQQDLAKHRLKFIGNPPERIKQDPLRIVRALRFALTLNFKLDKKTFHSINTNYHRLGFLTQSRIRTELGKIKNADQRKILSSTLDNPKLLDKYFK